MKRVGVLRGGAGEHYASSLRKGGDIISYIHENLSERWKAVDILVDKEGTWHLNGVSIMPTDLFHKVDVVWNTAHSSLFAILDNFSIPNAGVSYFSHILENSKEILREHMARIGVSMPRHIILPVYQKDFDGPRERYAIKKAKEVHQKFSAPWIVKSFTPDANMGVHLAQTFNELVAAIEDGVKYEKSISVEEFIAGKVASVHSLPNFRNEEIYVFPPVNVFGNFTSPEKEKLVNLAKDLHHHLDAKHYLKSNFVLNKRGKVFLLDFETAPNLKSYSHFSQACESVGVKMHQVIEHILEKTLS